MIDDEIVNKLKAFEASQPIRREPMTDNELLDAIKLLITTLDNTTWDEGHPGYSDSEPQYNCPDCSCEECYRVCCEFNKSALFKKLHNELPKLYENVGANK